MSINKIVDGSKRCFFNVLMSKKNHARAADKTGFSVALPTALTAQIEHIAAAQHRSRNGQIEHFLTDSVARWKREHPTSFSTYAQPEPDLRRDLAAEIDPALTLPPSDPTRDAMGARTAKPIPRPTALKLPRSETKWHSSATPPAAPSSSLATVNSSGKTRMTKEKKRMWGRASPTDPKTPR